MSDTAQTLAWSLTNREDAANIRTGHFWLPPGKESLDDRVSEIIQRLGLTSRLAELFPITKPQWYGLWINSPLSQEQCSFLHQICVELGKKSPSYRDNIRDFVEVLEEARLKNLILHVELAAPGHADFGRITTFAHCPRCKAEAPLERWQESYPTQNIICPVCSQLYSPVETFSVEEYEPED